MHRLIATTAAILAVLLLGIVIGLEIGSPARWSPVMAQANADGTIIAAAGLQNDAFCFLYNPATKQLVSYRQRPGVGLALQGIRTCASDFNPSFIEYPKSDSSTAVRKMKELAEKVRQSGK